MFITTGYLFVIGLTYRPFVKIFLPFWYLSILSLTDSLLYIFFIGISKDYHIYFSITKWSQLFYILFEFYVLSTFLIEINKLKKSNYYRYFIALSVLTILIITLLYNWDFKERYYSLFTIIELIFINVFSIRFLLIISSEIPNEEDKQISSLVKGIFIFINISSPYFIIIQFISTESTNILRSLSFVNDIGYTIFFIYVINFLKCQHKK